MATARKKMFESPTTTLGCFVESAVYDNLSRDEYGQNTPIIHCSCGYQACADTWEECGADYDQHLRDEGERE